MKTDKSSSITRDVNDFKDTWTLENALYILEHPTVDSKVWAEAVEWLLLYGPENIQNILLSASGNATSSCFPDLKNVQFTKDGDPCHSIDDIARALGIDVEEARNIMAEKEKAHGMRFSVEEEDTLKKQ